MAIMQSVTDLQRYVDSLTSEEVTDRLRVIVDSWPVYPMQVVTQERRRQALYLLDKLSGPDGYAWLDGARAYLHKQVTNHPDLASPWI